MSNAAKTLVFLSIVILIVTGFRATTTATPTGPNYTTEGALQFPERYRDWVFLSSGFDMSYSKVEATGDTHMFDNIFVDPNAYAFFKQTGTWPDKTQLVMEDREAKSKGSINQHGHFQTGVMGVEVHVKDTSRFGGKWAFFVFDDKRRGTLIPTTASCYQCHSEHAAADTTFVQFYPTLLPIAAKKGTLTRAYLTAP